MANGNSGGVFTPPAGFGVWSDGGGSAAPAAAAPAVRPRRPKPAAVAPVAAAPKDQPPAPDTAPGGPVYTPPVGYGDYGGEQAPRQFTSFKPLMQKLSSWHDVNRFMQQPADIGSLLGPTGQHIGQSYRRYLADPTEHYLARLSDVAQVPQAAEWAISQFGKGVDPIASSERASPEAYRKSQEDIRSDISTKLTGKADPTYSPTSQAIAHAITPGTPGAAVQDALLLMQPEMRETKGFWPMAGQLLGRFSKTGAIRSAVDLLSGENPLTGFLSGGTAQALQDLPTKGSQTLVKSWLSRHQTDIERKDVERVGAVITGKGLPFLKGRLNKVEDFVRKIVSDDGVNEARILHDQAQNELANHLGAQTFTVHVPGENADPSLAGTPKFDPNHKQPLSGTFNQLMAHVKGLNDRAHNQNTGVPGGSEAAATLREMAHDIKDQLIDAAGKVSKKKALLENWIDKRRQLDGIMEWQDMFKGTGRYQSAAAQKLLNQTEGTFNTDALIHTLQGHYSALKRSMGDVVDDVIKTLRHGSSEGIPKSYEPGEPWEVPFLKIKTPILVGSKPYDPLGTEGIPKSAVRPLGKWTGKIAGQVSTNIPSNWGRQINRPEPVEVEPPTGAKLLHEKSVEAVAPTRSAAATGLKVSEDLRKGRTPDVHRALARGEVSRDEIGKILKGADSTNPEESTAAIPIPDLLHAAEIGSMSEKRTLLPIIQKRMAAELSKMPNKTMQAKLAQRLQRLQLSIS